MKLPKGKLTKRGHPSYGSWYAMMRRCYVPTHERYQYYGARGIKVHERWHDFDSFVEDMGVRPTNKTLDRKHPDSDYGPGLCRWATATEQANNRRPFKSRT